MEAGQKAQQSGSTNIECAVHDAKKPQQHFMTSRSYLLQALEEAEERKDQRACLTDTPMTLSILPARKANQPIQQPALIQT